MINKFLRYSCILEFFLWKYMINLPTIIGILISVFFFFEASSTRIELSLFRMSDVNVWSFGPNGFLNILRPFFVLVIHVKRDLIAIRVLCLLADELDIVGAGVDELEFERSGETFVEGEGWFEAGRMYFLGIELGSCAEFLYSD